MIKKYPRGSEWRRWDLHIHTPASALSNSFESWDTYISAIEEQSEVSVVGATDYASIEGYKKLWKEKNENGRLQNIIKIFPNIEFRITPSTNKGKGINLHLILNPDSEGHIDRIEDSLGRLTFSFDGEKFPCTQAGITRLGRRFKPEITSDRKAFVEGANQFKVSIETIKEWYQSEPWILRNSIVVVANSSSDGASGIQHDDGLAATRREIYRFSHAIFSSRPADRAYFFGLGPDEKTKVVSQLGSLKPCIHGSDAHREADLFRPDQNRYCWIKADPTFDGLRQVTFEPESRVAIQETHPDKKVGYEIIDEVQFIDESQKDLFQTGPIQLNPGLNSIIGGKSSGKSLLLYKISKTANREETEKKRYLAGASDYSEFESESNFDFIVRWRDGTTQSIRDSGEQKPVTYIPQLYINKLAEKDGRNQLNELVEEIIYQNEGVKDKAEAIFLKRDQINEKISVSITKLVTLRSQYSTAKKDLEKTGSIKSVEQEILRIKTEIDRIQRSSGFTAEESRLYEKLSLRASIIDQRRSALEDLKSSLMVLEKDISEELASVSSGSRLFDGAVLSSKNSVVRNIVVQFRQGVNDLRSQSSILVRSEMARIDRLIERIELNKVKASDSLKLFLPKIKSQTELKVLQESLKREESRLKKTIEAKAKLDRILSQGKSAREKLNEYYAELYESYKELVLLFNEATSIDSESIKLEASVAFDNDKFDSFINCFDGRGSLSGILGDSIDSDNRYWFDQDRHLESVFDMEEKIRDFGKIQAKVKKSADEESLLRNLLQDNFFVSFNLRYNNDDIISMSPGKRGLVLLHLLLHLSNSSHPILIDQPEDNLDNRTVYNELRDFIRERKEKRQIIMVTHNANMVVSTDSECVIVANQAGQQHDMENEKFRFEYVSGSIECSFYDQSADSLLNKFGIREHICEVLEGGQLAFEERERKYAFNA